MNKKISVFFLFTSLVCSSAFAYDGCTNPTTAYDKTYCLGKLFIESDQELNDAYKTLINLVSPDVKKQLVATQRSWIHYRDNACSNTGTIDVQCNYKVNKDRLVYLQNRIRECKTGHCQNQLIVANNFSAST